MKKPILFYAISLAFYGQTLLAQIPTKPLNIQSPNVASLGSYGDIPVSLYTGRPTIQIPLYNLTNKSIDVPVALSYDASGFRPDQHPGWVGMGFSLSAGGVISRTIKSLRDESNVQYSGFPYAGYYFNTTDPYNSNPSNVMTNANWNQTSYMTNIASNIGNAVDHEPDEFTFNFGNYSGSFYLDASRNFHIKCDKPLKIAFLGTMQANPFQAPLGSQQINGVTSPNFSGFTITTEDGTQYTFGSTANTNAVEYSCDFFTQGDSDWLADAWYLTKIVNNTGQEVDFSYQSDNYFINQMYISIYELLGTSAVQGNNLTPTCDAYSNYSSIPDNNYQGQLIRPVYLSQISTPDQIIKFNISPTTELGYGSFIYQNQTNNWKNNTEAFLSVLTLYYENATGTNGQGYNQNVLTQLQWKELNSIMIENANGTLIKQYNFGYNNISTARLTLQTLTETGSDGTAKPPYQFQYDQSETLPGYCSDMTDHYGFYNKTSANGVSLSNYFATRQPNATYMLAGTLNKIIYPTGGITQFTYEPNYYRQQTSIDHTDPPTVYTSDMIGAGLRIKKIQSYDPNPGNTNQAITKQYFYANNFTNTNYNSGSLVGSGVLGGNINYYFNDYRLKSVDGSYTVSKSVFSSQSVLPGCINAQGSPIGYSEVEELNSDGSYKIYYYTNFDNGYGDEPADNVLQITRTQYEPFNSNQEERGKLYKEETYDNNNHLILSHQTHYSALNKSTSFVPCLKTNFTDVCQTGTASALVVVEGTAYRLNYYNYLPISESTTLYDQNNFAVTTTKSYTYENINDSELLASTSTVNSKNQTETTNYSYPNSFTDPVSTAMVTANVISPVIQKTLLINGTQESVLTTHYSAPYSNMFLPEYIQLQVAANPVETRQQYYYDASGSICEDVKPYGPSTSYQWEYNSRYPVVSISNASNTLALKEFYYDDGEEYTTGITGTAHTGHGYNPSPIITWALPNNRAYVISYWYRSNGVWYYSGEKSYVPQYVNQSSVIYQMTGGDGNAYDDIRIYPADAQITSYTYDPLVGMTSMIDAKGETTFYSYDSFQRLQNISDQNGNIVKSYCYNYAGQPTNCSVNVNSNPTPVITALAWSAVGGLNVIQVTYTPISNCTSAVFLYTDASTGTSYTCAGSGSSPELLKMPTANGYSISVTCYSNAYPSGITSAPVSIGAND